MHHTFTKHKPKMPLPHFLLVTYPAQGHINPALQLAKQIASTSAAHVTFVTNATAIHRINLNHHHPFLAHGAILDGYDENDANTASDSPTQKLIRYNLAASKSLLELVNSLSDLGRPVTCIIYTLLLPWAADVARQLGIPFVVFWPQPAAVFSVYYHYFHGYKERIESCVKDPEFTLNLPGLPPLASRDLPSFFFPNNPYSFFLTHFEEQFKTIDISKPKVLVNTFNALESDVMESMDGVVELIGVGPMVPSDKTFGGDLFDGDVKDYKKWLDAKLPRSVVYLSFGSLALLQKRQLEEITKGLMESGRPFLWVLRKAQREAEKDVVIETEVIEGREDERGMVVEWCSQVEVLSHPSIGCFVTHCGWNSTMESLFSGVPTVGVPQWSDQPTNAKMVEDVWGSGVRGRVSGEGVVEAKELIRCLDAVMGKEGEGERVRRKAEGWREKALDAVREGGSSHRSLERFVVEISDHESE
ncbi:UDP-glycosyltransferase 75D1 [Acorus gramineus]|uniref:Glycosyltransferase n=1 Tax=Acorus gramineus TaxID=55184 RepID=A0AAV9B1Q3_ACOGR|nr:UDP-glycosyltransferase 75D1 [Acorus gramineus]